MFLQFQSSDAIEIEIRAVRFIAAIHRLGFFAQKFDRVSNMSASRLLILLLLIAPLVAVFTKPVQGQASADRSEAKSLATVILQSAATSVDKLESGVAEGKLRRQTNIEGQSPTYVEADIFVAFANSSRRSDYLEVENASNEGFGALVKKYAVNEDAEYALETRSLDLDPPRVRISEKNLEADAARWDLRDVNVRRMIQPYDFEFQSIVDGIQNRSIQVDSVSQNEVDGVFRISYRYYGDENYLVELELSPREDGVYLSSERTVFRGETHFEIAREFEQVHGVSVPKKINFVNHGAGEHRIVDRAELDLAFSKVNQVVSPQLFSFRGFNLPPSAYLVDVSKGLIVRADPLSELQSATGQFIEGLDFGELDERREKGSSAQTETAELNPNAIVAEERKNESRTHGSSVFSLTSLLYVVFAVIATLTLILVAKRKTHRRNVLGSKPES